MLHVKLQTSKLLNAALIVALLLVNFPVTPAVAASAPPTILSYQGRLTDSGGNLLGGTGTTYYFKFSLWDSPTVGSGTKVWPTGIPATTTATVRQGVFNVNIGDTNNGYPDALNINFANYSQLYLQVEVSSDNNSSETLSPRQQMTSSVYAMVSSAVVGATSQSAFGTTSPIFNSVATFAATTSAAVPVSIIGAASQSANLFQILNNSFTNLFSVSASGLVSAAALSVSGGATTSALSVTGSTTIAGVFNSVVSNLLGSTTLLGSTLLTNATTTSFAISNIASGNLLKTTTGGAVVAAVAGTDYVTPSNLASAFPFTPSTFGSTAANATSTLIRFNSGIAALASSTIGSGAAAGGLTINGNATTTGIFVALGTATSSFANGLSVATSGGGLNVGTNTMTGLLTVLGSVSSGAVNIDLGNNASNATNNEVRIRMQTYSGQGATSNANYISSIEVNNATGANDMAFGVWGGGIPGLAEIMRLKGGTNQVGIGTTTPASAATLAVQGSALFSGNLSVASITATGTLAVSGSSTISSVLNVGGNALFNANVGIGTTAPATALAVAYSDNAFSRGLTITNTNGGTSAISGIAVTDKNRTYKGIFDFLDSNYTNAALAGSVIMGTVDNTKLGFIGGTGSGNPDIYFQSGANATPSIYITGSNGRVGIGSTTPWKQLSVGAGTTGTFAIATTTAGCAQFSAFGELYSTGSNCGTGTGSAGNWFTPTTFGSTAANATSTLTGFTAGLYVTASSTIGSGAQAAGLTVSGGATTTGNAYFAGNVGVGTNAPTSKLQVSGTVYAVDGSAELSLSNASGAFIDYGANNKLFFGNNSYMTMAGLTNYLEATNDDAVFTIRTTGQRAVLALAANGGTSPAITFTTQNSEAARIDINQRFGIGTTSPWRQLSVGNNNTGTFAISTSTAGCAQFSAFGELYSTGSNCGGSSFGFPFTATTNFGLTSNATSTLISFNAGITASSTVRLSDISTIGTLGFATTSVNATSTLITFSGRTFLTASTTSFNTSVGIDALANYQGGTGRHTAFGYQASNATTNTAQDTAAFGYQALKANNANFNSAFGFQALTANTSGTNNAALGYLALQSNTTSGSNAAFGSEALRLNITGNNNTALGARASGGNKSATSTVAVGFQAAYGNGSQYGAQGYTVVGYQAGNAMITGSDYNTLLGYQAGSAVTTGYANILVGASVTANNLTTGAGNLGFGNELFFPSASANNQLNIGNFLFGTLPATSTAFRLPTSGSLGVGTSSPFAKFAIQANNGDTAATLFAIGSSTASATTTLFSVSNTGSTTIANGVNITAGCFAVNGTCLSTGGASFGYPFSTLVGTANATSSLVGFTGGILATASSTIGNGNQTGGLTINGGATTTGNAYFAGNVGIGGQPSSIYKFTVDDNVNSDVAARISNSNSGNAASAGLLIDPGVGGALLQAFSSTFTANGAFQAFGAALRGTGGGGLSITSESSGPIRFYNNGFASNNETARISSTGALGVGTTSPFARISIHANPTDSTFVNTLFAIGSSTASATTTLFKIDNTGNSFLSGIASSTNVIVSSLGSAAGQCVTITSTGQLTTQSCGAVTGSTGNWFTPTTFGSTAANATSTLIGFTNGLYATASSTFTSSLTVGGAFAVTNTGTSSFAGNVTIGNANSNYFAGAPLVMTTNTNSFAQAVLQNTNSGTLASADFVFGGDLMTDTKYYGDIGYNSSTYADPNYSAFGPNSLYLYNSDADVAIATASTTNTLAAIKFFTGGTLTGNERARITSTGLFGLGTTSPFANFAIHADNGDTNRTLFAIGSSTASATTTLFAVTNTGQVGIGQYPTASGNILQTSATNALGSITTITNTTNSTALFPSFTNSYFNNGTGGYPEFVLSNQRGTSGSGLALATNDVLGSFEFQGGIGSNSSNSGAAIQAIAAGNFTGASSPTDLAFFTAPSGSLNYLERMRIEASGMIGIGTSTPYAGLSIHSSVNNNLGTTLFAIASSTNTATTTLFSVLNNGTFSVAGNSNAFFTLPNAVDRAFGFGTSTSNPTLTISTRASLSGFVGIGTSTPWGKFSLELGPLDPALVVANQGSTTPAFYIGGINKNGFVGIGTSTPAVATNFVIATSSSVAGNMAAFNVQTNFGTTTIGFFSATSTGLLAGNGLGLSSNLRNLLIVGNGVQSANIAVVKGSICVDNDGWCTPSTTASGSLGGGEIAARHFTTAGTDVAELYDAHGDIVPGQIVAADGGRAVAIATSTSGTIGIVSTKPGITLSADIDYDSGVPVALTGRVPLLINLDNGPIKTGDRITVSTTTPGTGMKAGPYDASVAVALESFDGATTTKGTILAFVSLTTGSSVATSSAAIITGPFAAASQALKDAFSTAINAITSIAQNGIRNLGAAIYATVGTFDKIFTKSIHTDELCVEDVCVNKDQFLKMVQASSVQAASPAFNGTASASQSTGSANPSGDADTSNTTTASGDTQSGGDASSSAE